MGTIPLLTLESRIKRRLRTHLRGIGFTRDADGLLRPPGDSKNAVRAMHSAQRKDRLIRDKAFVSATWPRVSQYFADGVEVVPEAISPRLEGIAGGTWQSELFRLAGLTWSIPISEGYGRRMRFLVWDEQCN